MTNPTSDGSGHLTLLAQQAEEVLDQDTTWVELAGELAVMSYKNQDKYNGWHSCLSFRPMFVAYLWAKTEAIPLSTIKDELQEQPELARAIGFEPNNIPSSASFRPARMEKRFGKLQPVIESTAEQIQEIGRERGSEIGYDPLELSQEDEDEDEGPPSERTIDRLLRKNSKQVLEELKSSIIPSISLPRPDDPIYDDDELLVLESIAAIKLQAANGAGDSLADEKNPEGDLEAPYYADGPDGETLLNSIKKLSIDDITEKLNYALKKTYLRAKPRLQELENDNGKRFGTRENIALDMTYVAYYGEREGMEWVVGAPDDKSYDWCHKFATATIVGQNTHYVVGVCSLGNTEHIEDDAYARNNDAYYVGNVARRLLDISDEYVDIRCVYADREFHAVDALETLDQRDLNYVIPAVTDKNRLAKKCDNFDTIKRGYDEEHDTPLYVKLNYAMYGPVKYGPSNTKVETNLVILPPREDDEVHEDGSPQPFLTNYDVNDEIALDRRRAKYLIEQYDFRAAIENSYCSIKKCAAWTTSKEFEIRWFHFAFGCVVYNLWLLIDFLTQERVGVIETRKKPRITLSRFLEKLKRELVTLL